MCGRMIVLTYDEVLQVVQAMSAGPDNPYPDWPARAPIDAYPQDDVPIVGALPGVGDASTGRELGTPVRLLRWGYPVEWQAGPVFNTRIESIASGRGMWRESFEKGRCLVPTRGFFERHGTQKVRSAKTGRLVKRQYAFELVDEPITWLAGISEGDHFSVVTTDPNGFVAPVHERMPVVLRREELPLWMAGELGALADRSDVELIVKPEGQEADEEGEQLSLF